MSNLLILDNSTDLLEILKEFLELEGYSVRTATNKKQLLEEIEKQKPDLLILDVFLAGEDGREVCSELRSQKNGKLYCILMFSATASVLADYKKYGADGVLEKPFNLTELVEKIEETLEECRHHVS